jgi:hypothetical protein
LPENVFEVMADLRGVLSEACRLVGLFDRGLVVDYGRCDASLMFDLGGSASDLVGGGGEELVLVDTRKAVAFDRNRLEDHLHDFLRAT